MNDEPRKTLADGAQIYPAHRELREDGQQKGYVVLAEEERACPFKKAFGTFARTRNAGGVGSYGRADHRVSGSAKNVARNGVGACFQKHRAGERGSSCRSPKDAGLSMTALVLGDWHGKGEGQLTKTRNFNQNQKPS